MEPSVGTIHVTGINSICSMLALGKDVYFDLHIFTFVQKKKMDMISKKEIEKKRKNLLL